VRRYFTTVRSCFSSVVTVWSRMLMLIKSVVSLKAICAAAMSHDVG
jgi:hypothetical protein